jgi:hypothetical protein
MLVHRQEPRSTIVTRPAHGILAAVAVLGLLLGQPHLAAAQDDTAQAKAHYVKGKEHLAAGRLEEAAQEFKKAYLLKRIPAILFNIAQVYRKLGDRKMAIHFFDKFLQEAPATDPNRKEAKAIVDALKGAGAPTPTPTPEPRPTPRPEPPRVVRGVEAPPPVRREPRHRKRRVDVFTHEALDEVPPDKPLDVTCQVPDREGARVTLFYRVAGQESFTPVPMKERLGEWVGRIPAREMSGKSIQYYLEAKDHKGKSLGNSGSAANPNIILIAVGARPHYYADMGDEGKGDDFVVAPRKPKPSDRPPRDLRIWKWTAAGLSAALVGTGVGLYVFASKQASTLESKASSRNGTLPANRFSSTLRDMQSSGKLNMTMGTVALVSGIVLAGGAVVLFIFDESKRIEKEPAATTRRASVAPILGPSAFGLTGQVTF